jgi:hypothetical protein
MTKVEMLIAVTSWCSGWLFCWVGVRMGLWR